MPPWQFLLVLYATLLCLGGAAALAGALIALSLNERDERRRAGATPPPATPEPSSSSWTSR